MRLIVGLGNPGKQYEGTRHNAGFMTIDAICKEIQAEDKGIRRRAFCAEGVIGSEKCILIKPVTFMNLSGESVSEYMRFYKLSPDDVILIYDDTDIPTGSVRVRKQGTAGGHNGVKSVIWHLNTDVFNRVRVGINAKPKDWDLVDYVLTKFSKDEQPALEEGIEKAKNAVQIIVKEGADAAMNKFNSKVKKEGGNE
ncbi:MAG: aminoacyl-tRNA hydrolase [Clostridiales bacterium]|nr:aminoacyl-tRNA hydrolase [Clostridiales bacterium]